MNLRPLFRRRRPVSSSDAGRALAATRHGNERARIRATTIEIAERIGRPDLAEPLR